MLAHAGALEKAAWCNRVKPKELSRRSARSGHRCRLKSIITKRGTQNIKSKNSLGDFLIQSVTCRATAQPSESFREMHSRALIHRSSTLLTGLKTKGDELRIDYPFLPEL
jgi:hypothetical protein